jgi:hypothetical protein
MFCFDEAEIAAQLYEIGDLQYKGYGSGVPDTLKKRLFER